ncbi:MAG: acyl carrier protein [Alphaproteobacteria bacterium]|nr:acyl carrier protein [Alphaproteobacteria bacterium]
MADIESALLEIVKEHAVGLAGELSRDTPVADLGIDSFAVVEIIYEVEEKLGIEVPFNANENPLEGMKTVGDLIDAVKKLAAPK